MTRVFGTLFEDGRAGILCVKPSKPFFGCDLDEQHFNVVDGAIDCNLLSTPSGITYLVGFKQVGDSRRTNFFIRWRVPNQQEIDITPAVQNSTTESGSTTSPTIFERVQLKRVAGELSNSLNQNDELNLKLVQAETRVAQLESELRSFQLSSDSILFSRDQTIAQLQEKHAPVVKTVYLNKPVPSQALYERITRLEQENLRLIELNSEYYKSVVDLYQLQLDKARNSSQVLPAESQSSPQKRLLRKLLDK